MNPVGASNVSSPFGEKRKYETHPGVDIPVPSGTSIKAPLDGVVKTANINHNRMCGGTIDIDYGNGFWSRFCHCSKIDVKEGDIVVNTGSTPIKLHMPTNMIKINKVD